MHTAGALTLALATLGVSTFSGDAGAFTSFSPPLTGAADFVMGAPAICFGGIGPVGVAFDESHFFATDFCNGTTYRFPLSGGDFSSPETQTANGLSGGLAVSDGHYYGINQSAGLYAFDPTTLAVLGTLIASIANTPRAVVVDPLSPDPTNPDLFVSSGSGIFQVNNPNSAPMVTPFASGNFDGLYFTTEGSRLYAANVGDQHVNGFDRSGMLVLDVDLSGHGPDGIAVATPNTTIGGIDVSNNIFVNCNDGTIQRIDANTGNAVSVVASGGSRGDFVTVGPDGCFYATQTDRVVKLAPCFFQSALTTTTSTSTSSTISTTRLTTTTTSTTTSTTSTTHATTTITSTTTSTTTTTRPTTTTTSTTTTTHPTTTSSSSTTASSTTHTTTSTTSTSTTTTTARQPTTTTSSTMAAATSTTVPSGCTIAPTFASIDCRLDVLIAQVTAATDLGRVKESLLRQLNRAKERKEQAAMFCEQGQTRKGRAALQHAIRWMIDFVHRVRSITGLRQIPEPTRQRFVEDGKSILEDMQTLPCTPAIPSTTTVPLTTTTSSSTTTTVPLTTTTRPPTTTTVPPTTTTVPRTTTTTAPPATTTTTTHTTTTTTSTTPTSTTHATTTTTSTTASTTTITTSTTHPTTTTTSSTTSTTRLTTTTTSTTTSTTSTTHPTTTTTSTSSTTTSTTRPSTTTATTTTQTTTTTTTSTTTTTHTTAPPSTTTTTTSTTTTTQPTTTTTTTTTSTTTTTAPPACRFPATGQTTCWDSSGTVIPCAGTGQDGDLQKGAPLTNYTDNGDGTITDNNTGLVWEKLSMDGSVHDVSNGYTWDDAFAVHVATLNSTPSFAGHNDWRVPNVRELESIVNFENFNPAVSPAFNTGCAQGCTVATCSCTQNSFYWSSTTDARAQNLAWQVTFGDGGADSFFKGFFGFPVRAVRGNSSCFPATGQTTSYRTGDDGDIKAGAPLKYTDNGDGTITDVNTGLMWEKQSNGDGSVHDIAKTYTWDQAFTGHVATLNSMNSGMGFAGHTDWRLPNVRELESIVNFENSGPTVSPEFNTATACAAVCTVTTCSCTQNSFYWSSTTNNAGEPTLAWGVSFTNGIANNSSVKSSSNSGFTAEPVRAVRGGS